MSMPRGLHPETMPQRDGRPGHWSIPVGDQVEYRDAPMGAVGKGIAWILFALLLIVGAALIFTSAIKPRTPLMAASAERQFHAPPPALEVAAPANRAVLEKAHSGPGDQAIERAMDAVVRQGWGDSAPPPNRGAVALHRAQAGR